MSKFDKPFFKKLPGRVIKYPQDEIPYLLKILN